jgi:glycerol-3-phosphate dehydrogenase (NAD(P)+)
MDSGPILVVGAGSWGTALAILLARNGHAVTLWGHNPEHIALLAQQRQNQRFLPGVQFPDNLLLEADLDQALQQSRDILCAVPCKGLRALLKHLAAFVDVGADAGMKFCWACKGLEVGTQKLVDQIVTEELGATVAQAVISGPTFATEVAAGLPGAATVASLDEAFAELWVSRLHGETFRAYSSEDVIGVELGGALKNVIAIAAGMADGLGFGANTRVALITRGLAEIMRLGEAMGARRETFMGLAGIGDLTLTCTDDQSRNRRMGKALAKGLSVAQAEASIGQAVEGIKTAYAAAELAKSQGIELPITEQVVAILQNQCTPTEAVQALLSRQPGKEI